MITFNEIRVPEGMQFNSLESEVKRCYHFPDLNALMIDNPIAIHVRESGAHVVIDGNETVHYIPQGWIHLTWYVKDGANHVDF